MRRTAVIVVVVSLFVTTGHGGFYQLIISNDTLHHCGPGMADTSPDDFPVRTARAISRDIIRYFSGEEPVLGLFRACFGNGRIIFCGTAEKVEIERALITANFIKKIHHERDLHDFCFMFGSKRMAKLIDEELKSKNLSTQESERFKRMRTRILEGIRVRTK